MYLSFEWFIFAFIKTNALKYTQKPEHIQKLCYVLAHNNTHLPLINKHKYLKPDAIEQHKYSVFI